MKHDKAKLIVALDIDSFEKARELIDILSPVVDIFKVGSQLFTACGPVPVRFILAKGKKVFLDLKYHDIPNTVASSTSSTVALFVIPAVQQIANNQGENPGVFMLTVHTSGGRQMLEAAVRASQEKAKELKVRRPLIIGVTVLTSEEKKENIQQLVLERALLAKEAGCDGVVASVEEASLIRQKFGKDFVIVTPGIRPKGTDVNDQKRIATPSEAVARGSNFLVVGRPIVEAENPLEAAKKILAEMNAA
ncbi:MAG TPA: orotidine-5'-phosphate decarboxylase [Candidatus Omnitrophota bacterium]|nr:orotidine-5'-phosphate decarboxylase [Candidatus Omnitrophota bacterium]HPD84490.1 orotidine-5'-phosphate decarboxylase [Candidatus Omnitrophota bacterium]HRZ03348.1 orotidine-5'-phosphate decarboxylase [Candidatus Omnitrophota bacterium]